MERVAMTRNRITTILSAPFPRGVVQPLHPGPSGPSTPRATRAPSLRERRRAHHSLRRVGQSVHHLDHDLSRLL